ncbi:MAG: hypothetical protein ACPGYV_05620 [Phycisphaeraceae bacterium]
MRRAHAFALLIPLAAVVCLAVGCSALRDTDAPPQTVKRLAALDYPQDAPHGPDLDILLVRSGGQVRLVNRTPTSYAGMQLWLNRQYVRDSGSVQIGTDNLRDLTDFINLYEEPYPVGTFLNPDQTAPLVLAEFYDPRTNIRHRLLVRPGNASTIVPFEELNN